MDAKKLIELRKQAEKAVADMPEGELKLKAFEVMLQHVLSGVVSSPSPQMAGRAPTPGEAAPESRVKVSTRSITGRLLVLKDEGFFRNQRSIGEVRQELQAHGWHYPLTTLSGPMQSLVQKRTLRRQKGRQGKREVWKYSNH